MYELVGKGLLETAKKAGPGIWEAVAKGVPAGAQAVGQAAHELATNEDLHKGVRFGVRAAGEVSKDVWDRVAQHVR